MNDGDGNTVFDYSGNENYGTLVDGTSWEAGKFGSALRLDGADNYLNLGDFRSLFTDEATVNIWIKLDVDPPAHVNQTGIGVLDNTGLENHYPYTDGTIYLSWFRNDRLNLGNIGVDKSNWHALTITNTPGANGWKFYQNGIEYYNNTGEAAIGLGASGNIGEASGGVYHLDGMIDNILLYNQALTPAQVAYLYQHLYYAWERTPIWSFGSEILAPGEAIVSKMYGINMSNVAKIYNVPKEVCA